MTTVMDNIKYTPDIIPIYVVEWNVRDHDIERYHRWISVNFDNVIPMALYPSFIDEELPPKIITHSTEFKMAVMLENIRLTINSACVIYARSNMIYDIYEAVKVFCVPRYLSDDHTRFKRLQMGIYIIDDINLASDISPDIPIHIMNLNSDNGMSMMKYPHHKLLHIYVDVSDITQYKLLSSGIIDANRVYESLVRRSRLLYTDMYSNLYIR